MTDLTSRLRAETDLPGTPPTPTGKGDQPQDPGPQVELDPHRERVQKLHPHEGIRAQGKDREFESVPKRNHRAPVRADLDRGAVREFIGFDAEAIELQLPNTIRGQRDGAGETGVDDQTK